MENAAPITAVRRDVDAAQYFMNSKKLGTFK